MKQVMADGGLVGENCEVMATSLAHGIRDDALLLHLYLRVIMIKWLPQLEGDEQVEFLGKFRIGKLPRVHGMLIRGCLSTRTITNRYNRV